MSKRNKGCLSDFYKPNQRENMLCYNVQVIGKAIKLNSTLYVQFHLRLHQHFQVLQFHHFSLHYLLLWVKFMYECENRLRRIYLCYGHIIYVALTISYGGFEFEQNFYNYMFAVSRKFYQIVQLMLRMALKHISHQDHLDIR